MSSGVNARKINAYCRSKEIVASRIQWCCYKMLEIWASVITVSCSLMYRIARKFGGELNLAVWWSSSTTAKLKSAKISYFHIYV